MAIEVVMILALDFILVHLTSETPSKTSLDLGGPLSTAVSEERLFSVLIGYLMHEASKLASICMLMEGIKYMNK